MANNTIKITIPIVLVGILAIIIVVATSYDQLQPGFYIVVAFFIVFMFFFGIATGQRFTSPIQDLLKNAKELSKGNLYSRAHLETKDELAELADTFNKIAEDLQKSHEEQANIEKSVGLKVKAKTQELEETINALQQKVNNRTIELERLVKEISQLQEVAKNNSNQIIPPQKL